MESNSHDRDLRRARLAYVAAVRSLDAALGRLGVSDVPLEPGPGPEPRPWSAEHVEVMRELAAAAVAVLDRRRAWDTLRREWRPPH
jgi:GAF domain-containing protein